MSPCTTTPLFSALLLGVSAVAWAGAEPAPDFNRDIRPILSNNCFKCHGPDEKARKSGLRLDRREAALKEAKSGELAIVPGAVDRSEMAVRIRSTDEDEMMPPPDSGKKLTVEQKALLERWIAAGAEYREHWAFVAPKAEAPPMLGRSMPEPANPIDAFVLKRLAEAGLPPSPEADPATLLRRVSLDLTGLPPTPEEAKAFLKDPSPQAYEKAVDRLLASPHYGERWARPWLDLARYADTNGYEKDRNRSIWPWRDWVINALNADKPFDQFTVEQLAGDLLPNASRDQVVATGFHRNTMLNEEGGIDPLEYRFHAMTDRVATTGVTWMGLTVGCAQCHTHKFDPITQREYYQIMAFLNNADEPELDLWPTDVDAQRKKRSEELERLITALPGQWPVESLRWEPARAPRVEAASGQVPRMLEDGSAMFAEASPERDTYTVTFESGLEEISALRLEALADASLPSSGPGRVKHGNFVLSEVSVMAGPLAGGELQPVKLVRAAAEASQKDYEVEKSIDGRKDTGWAVEVGGNWHVNRTATFTFEKPVRFAGGTRLVVRLDQQHGLQHTLGRIRLSAGQAGEGKPVETQRRDAMEAKLSEWLARERARTVAWTTLPPVEAYSNSPVLSVQKDGSVLASGDITKIDIYELKLRVPAGVTALRLEALPDDRLPGHGPGLAYYEGPKGDFFLGEFEAQADGKALRFVRPTESYSGNAMGGSPVNAALAIDGNPETGWSANGRQGQASQAVFPLEAPLAKAGELSLKMSFGRHYAASLGRFRISCTTDVKQAGARDMPAELDVLLSLPDGRLTVAQRDSLRRQFLLTAPELAGARKRIEELLQPMRAPVTTLVMRERPAEHPRPTFLYNRGEFLQPKEPVEAGVLAVLPGLPAGAKHDRLAFARWLVSPENPLTARVTVNRQWAILFGRGLVKTTEDFGYQGEPPSHPELLDWLAVEFVRLGWSLKKLHRLIVTSATYRQSSRVTPELMERDPENRLLARGPRHRLEAEMIRDTALAASGLLSGKIGGPGVYPPQAEGVSEVAYGSPRWTVSGGEDRYRRGLYTFAKRTAPYAMLTTFDGPAGEACLARREVSNSPLQALTMLNDIVVLEAAQALGRVLAGRGGSVEDGIAELYWRCLSRPPAPEETARLRAFWQAQKARCAAGELDAKRIAGEGPGDAAERAAWTLLARAVFNLDEVITKS